MAGVTKEARILTVSRAVQATAGKGTVEVEVDNAGGAWKAGFSADATVSLAPAPRMVVPARALLLTSDGAFVYAIEEEDVSIVRVLHDSRESRRDIVQVDGSESEHGRAPIGDETTTFEELQAA